MILQFAFCILNNILGTNFGLLEVRYVSGPVFPPYFSKMVLVLTLFSSCGNKYPEFREKQFLEG